MPIYEYACPHCRKTFEEWLKSDDEAATHPCPDCGQASPRVISHTSFILKGGGWYVTEYGSHHAETETEQENSPADGENSADKPSGDAGKESPTPAATSETASTSAPAAPAAGDKGGKGKSVGDKGSGSGKKAAGAKTPSAKGTKADSAARA